MATGSSAVFLLADRDAYVLTVLARVTAGGLSGRSAVLAVLRACRLDDVLLSGMDKDLLDADVTALQTAVSALSNADIRAAAVAQAYAIQASTRGAPLYPLPTGVDSTAAYRTRVVQAGF